MYQLDLKPGLKVWICMWEYDMYSLQGGHTPVAKHPLSNEEWDFTGRYRYYKNRCGDVRLDVEVRYTEWRCVKRETTGWWDRFINGSYETRPFEETMWVAEGSFNFVQQVEYNTYCCGSCSPEVSYG